MACYHNPDKLFWIPSEVSVEFSDIILEVKTDTAKLNLFNLFNPFFPELDDGAKYPQIQVDVKDAVCWVLSQSDPETRQRYDLESALNSLWREACNLQEIQAQLPKGSVRPMLDPVRKEFDDIAMCLSTLGPEELFQLLRKAFFRGNNIMEGALPCPLITRKDVRSLLVNSFGKECVDFDPSQSLMESLNKFLAFSYDG
jgi:hypothetical protein